MSGRKIADFRSDTVTHPTPAMREAMAEAPLGDDVFGDDPTVRELEDFAARLFGKERALYLPSGTMANQVAARVHTRRGNEVILEAGSHTFFFEQGGLAALSGLQARPLAGERGRIPVEELEAAIRTENEHFPVTSLIVLENTHNMAGGTILSIDYLREVKELADRHGIKFHLDGARICNAEAATGIPLADWAATADTVSCCLSKGLAAPIGTVLVGTEEVIREARRVRKLFGGGMRQVGVIAAAGLVALRDMRGRLVEDHRRAKVLAAGLNEKPGLSAEEPETNLVYVATPKGAAASVAARFAKDDVLCIPIGPSRVRFVTHNDVDDEDVGRALAVDLKPEDLAS